MDYDKHKQHAGQTREKATKLGRGGNGDKMPLGSSKRPFFVNSKQGWRKSSYTLVKVHAQALYSNLPDRQSAAGFQVSWRVESMIKSMIK